MSAYALPGSFFFPATSGDSDIKGTQNKNRKLNNDDFSSPMNSAKKNQRQDSWYKTNDLFVSITSASIDHLRLIQGFTSTRSSTNKTNIFRDKVANISNSLTGFSLSSSQHESKHDSAKNSMSPSKPGQNHFSAKSSTHDEAVQFTLSISFNGREYTATRPLPSFVKLRNDLLVEVQNRKNSGTQFGNHRKHEIFHESKEFEEEKDVIIPELPLGNKGANGNTGGLVEMAGRGFRGLQETVRAYCPPMEEWIQSVAALVPTSPTLANFLWEPIQHGSNQNNKGASSDYPVKASLTPSSNSILGSMQALNSIVESDGSDSDDSDADY